VPHWAEEPVLVLGPALGQDLKRFPDLDASTPYLQSLILWHGEDPSAQATKSSLARLSSGGKAGNVVDVACYYRRPGSSQAHVAVLEAAVASCRLQAALPAHVPMSLRLVVRTDPPAPGVPKVALDPRHAKVQSEPLLLLMSEASDHLKPMWEVWARQAHAGVAQQWTYLPEELQTSVEAAWLEGQPKVAFELPEPVASSDGSSPACLLSAGRYEMTFGDDRMIQHSVRKVGAPTWQAKARRIVRDADGEDCSVQAIMMEDQCVICMERRRTHAFMHADTGDGHLAVCADCAESFKAEAAVGGASRAVRTCPMCRRSYSAVQRIYQ